MARTMNHAKRARLLGVLLASALTLTASLALTGCPKKGPAQKAGEKIDSAKDKVSDTLNPKGPVEKAGRAIDRATDK